MTQKLLKGKKVDIIDGASVLGSVNGNVDNYTIYRRSKAKLSTYIAKTSKTR